MADRTLTDHIQIICGSKIEDFANLKVLLCRASDERSNREGEVQEQRKSPRKRVLMGGHIVFNGGRSTIDCIIHNWSDSGALLRVRSPIGIPASFDLVTSDKASRTCRIVRRAAHEIGVVFN